MSAFRYHAIRERLLNEHGIPTPGSLKITAPGVTTGLVPSDDDVRDYPFVPSGRLPTSEIDYRGECSPIKNQLHRAACSAFETVGHAERIARRFGYQPLFSERANYNMARQLMGLKGDSGASLRAAIHAGYKYGLPLSSSFPYSDDPVTIADLTVPDAVMQEAATNRFDSYYRIDTSLVDTTALNRRIDMALADGLTVGVGIFLHYWFYFVSGPLATHTSIRNNPPPGVNWGAIIGLHAMDIVGRSDSMGGYICRNSWGTNWGDGGYYLMAYADTYEAFEFWAVRGFDGAVIDTTYDTGSDEAKTARLYRAAFGRYADRAGLDYWSAAMSEWGARAVATSFLQSGEFALRYGHSPTDAYFVTLLYQNVLRRDPDPSGYTYWTDALAQGLPRADVLMYFAESPENKANP